MIERRSFWCHPDSRFSPGFGVFFSMSPHQVAVAFDLRAALFDQASFNVGLRQMYGDQIAIHRFVAPEAKVLNPKLRLGVEINPLA